MVADLETPVSALMKLADGKPDSLLFESVEGGAVRGRYSFIGLKPDLIWRCKDGRAEINRRARIDRTAFEPADAAPLESLRALVAESRIALPGTLPPMAAGLFGYLGYEMVALVERVPQNNPDALGIPDAYLLRPTVVAIFDNIEDLVTLVTPLRPRPGVDADAAYDEACARLADVLADFDRSLPHRRETPTVTSALPQPVSTATRADYGDMVERAKEYIRAGDIFQVVPSQRWSVPISSLPPFALYRALRRLNPSPLHVLLRSWRAVQIVGASSPEILVRAPRQRKVTIRPIAGTRPRACDRTEANRDEDLRLEPRNLLADPKECAEHLMLLDLGRNDVGRVAEDRQRQG